MSDIEKPKQITFSLMLGTLILGLASFIIWVLRIASRSKDEKTTFLLKEPDLAMSHPNDTQLSGFTGAPRAFTSKPATEIPGQPLQSSPPSATSVAPGVLTFQTKPVTPVVTGVETHWSAPTRYMAGAGLFIFFLWLIGYSRQSLILLIFAALIAILTRPAIHFLQKRLRFSAGLAVVLIYLLVAVLLFALPLLIIPNIIAGINSLLNYNWQGLVQRIVEVLNQWANEASAIPLIGTGLANSLQSITEFGLNLSKGLTGLSIPGVSIETLIQQIGTAIGLFANLLGPLVSGILSLVFLLLISLQMSLSSGQIRGWIINPVPQRYKEEIGSLLDRILLVWVSFLRGQFSLMVVMGVLVWLMNLLLGTPQALLLGLLAGFLEIIPSLGPILATIPAAILALLFGSSHLPGLNPWVFMLIVILGYVLLNLVENQVLVPRILGEAVNLPPLIVLIGVTIAGTTAGIVGVFLATPMMASGRELLEYVLSKVNETPEIKPPDENKPSFTDQLRGFLGRIHIPSRRSTKANEAVPSTTGNMVEG